MSVVLFAALAFAAAPVLEVEGTCPTAAEIAIDPSVRTDGVVFVRSDPTRVQIEMRSSDGRIVAEKTITDPPSCRARGETVAVMIEAWALELALRETVRRTPLFAAREAATKKPNRPALATPPVLQDSSAPSGRWIAFGAGLAVIAGSVSLNVAAERDSALDQPTDFVPALLYIAGATLIGTALFSD